MPPRLRYGLAVPSLLAIRRILQVGLSYEARYAPPDAVAQRSMNHILHPLLSFILSSLSPLAAFVLGGLFNFALNERTKKNDRLAVKRESEHLRMLELHKIAYPEKVKAANIVMNMAGSLYFDVTSNWAQTQSKQQFAAIDAKLNDLLWQAKAYEPYLGPDVIKAVVDFRTACHGFFVRFDGDVPKTQLEDQTWIHDASYRQLTGSLCKILYLQELDQFLIHADTRLKTVDK